MIPSSDRSQLAHGLHAVITGSGSALIDPLRGGASVAVVIDGEVLQFDFGRLAMENLAQAGINPVDIDRLFLTHLHFDHIASYGYFVISSWIACRQTSLPVVGPEGTAAMSHNAIHGTHAVDFRYVKALAEAWPEDIVDRPRDTPPVEVEDFAAPGVVVTTPNYTVTTAPTEHYRDQGIISQAYRVDCEYGSVVITGDARPTPALVELATGADLLIAECAKPDAGMLSDGKLMRSKATTGPSGGHNTPTWLGEMAAEADVGSLIATHLGPFTSVPAAIAMSRVYYGDEPGGSDFWDLFQAKIKASYDGEFQLASDGLIVAVGTEG